jgi:hypothetical protein
VSACWADTATGISKVNPTRILTSLVFEDIIININFNKEVIKPLSVYDDEITLSLLPQIVYSKFILFCQINNSFPVFISPFSINVSTS